jgi:23S rRNA (guanosine2251-2'-O)-methyltransferase
MNKDNIIYGKHSVEEALGVISTKIEQVFMLDANKNDLQAIKTFAQKRKVKVSEVSKKEFENNIRKIFNGKVNHQNVYAVVKPYKYFDMDKLLEDVSEDSLVLILSHITDVNNFGAIIRSAVAFGVDFIVIPKDRSVEVNASVFKTSSGCALKTKICKVTNLSKAIKDLQDVGFWVYAADSNSKKMISDINFSGKKALVMGSEGKGVGHAVLKASDESFLIPMSEKAESLNVSVATAVCMYHIQFVK